MILIYNITTAIVSSKDNLKITAGPERKQDKNIDKNSEKINGLADEGSEFLKSCQEKNVMCSHSLNIHIHYVYSRSLKAKASELERLILDEDLDVTGIAETWLDTKKQQRELKHYLNIILSEF